VWLPLHLNACGAHLARVVCLRWSDSWFENDHDQRLDFDRPPIAAASPDL
jgi:hypothetical protein